MVVSKYNAHYKSLLIIALTLGMLVSTFNEKKIRSKNNSFNDVVNISGTSKIPYSNLQNLSDNSF